MTHWVRNGAAALLCRFERPEGAIIPNGISWCLHIRAGDRRLVVGWWVVSSLISVIDQNTESWTHHIQRTRVPFWAFHRKPTDDLHSYLSRS
jgi:hypothetical protein